MAYRVRKEYTVQYKGKWVSGGTVLDLTPEEYKGFSHLMEIVPDEKEEEAPTPKVEEEEEAPLKTEAMDTASNRAILTPGKTRSHKKVGV
jgi:DNA replication initiation complex subunit (GINS family)